MSLRPFAIAVAFMAPVVAFVASADAEELRDFCPNRPGLGTPTCIIDKGHVAVELGIADWTRERDTETNTDTTMFGETVLRYGLTDTLEIDIGWDGYGVVRTRDDVNGTSRADGGGDVSIAFRQNIMSPDGSGTSLSVMPYITLPTGSDAFTSGDWGAGLIVPVSFEIAKNVSLAFSPEIDAAVDADGEGRHLVYGSVAGLGFALTDKLGLTLELSMMRDQDPDGASTEALAGMSLAWKVRDDLQVDIGAVAGLNDASPDVELYTGVARRF